MCFIQFDVYVHPLKRCICESACTILDSYSVSLGHNTQLARRKEGSVHPLTGVVRREVAWVEGWNNPRRYFIRGCGAVDAESFHKRCSWSPLASSLFIPPSIRVHPLSSSACWSSWSNPLRLLLAMNARNMQQTTVNQWASSAGSYPGIFPDGQRQQHR